MKRLLFAVAVLAASAITALAADSYRVINVERMPVLSASRTADQMPMLADASPAAPAQVIPTPLSPLVTVAPPSAFDTIAVAPAKESVAFGDYAGALINWLAVLLIPVLAPFLVDLWVKFRARFGLQTTDAQRAKLQDMIANGVALGAHDAQASLSGKLTFEVKNKIMASAVAYAKDHGAETLKALGVDPTSAAAEEALRARAAKMLADLDQSATAVQAGVPATPPSPLAPDTPKAA